MNGRGAYRPLLVIGREANWPCDGNDTTRAKIPRLIGRAARCLPRGHVVVGGHVCWAGFCVWRASVPGSLYPAGCAAGELLGVDGDVLAD